MTFQFLFFTLITILIVPISSASSSDNCDSESLDGCSSTYTSPDNFFAHVFTDNDIPSYYSSFSTITLTWEMHGSNNISSSLIPYCITSPLNTNINPSFIRAFLQNNSLITDYSTISINDQPHENSSSWKSFTKSFSFTSPCALNQNRRRTGEIRNHALIFLFKGECTKNECGGGYGRMSFNCDTNATKNGTMFGSQDIDCNGDAFSPFALEYSLSNYSSFIPTFVPTFVPTAVPTIFPTFSPTITYNTVDNRLQIFIYYNDTLNIASDFTKLINMGKILLNASLTTYEQISGYSYDYADKQVTDTPWIMSGLQDFRYCAQYTYQYFTNNLCPDFTSLEIYENPIEKHSQYFAFGTFGITVDKNIIDFRSFVIEIFESDEYLFKFTSNLNDESYEHEFEAILIIVEYPTNNTIDTLTSSSNDFSLIYFIAFLILATFFICILILILVIYCVKKKNKHYKIQNSHSSKSEISSKSKTISKLETNEVQTNEQQTNKDTFERTNSCSVEQQLHKSQHFPSYSPTSEIHLRSKHSNSDLILNKPPMIPMFSSSHSFNHNQPQQIILRHIPQSSVVGIPYAVRSSSSFIPNQMSFDSRNSAIMQMNMQMNIQRLLNMNVRNEVPPPPPVLDIEHTMPDLPLSNRDLKYDGGLSMESTSSDESLVGSGDGLLCTKETEQQTTTDCGEIDGGGVKGVKDVILMQQQIIRSIAPVFDDNTDGEI